MSYGINFGTTADQYTDVNTIVCPECWRIDLIVSGNTMVYQLQAASDRGQTGDAGLWLPERVLPASQTFTLFTSLDRRCTGFRARSYKAGQPVTYCVELVPPSELPPVGDGATPTGSERMGNPYPYLP